MNKQSLSTAATLRKAARLVRERGWCQHRTEDSEGRLCAIGAISRANIDAYRRWLAIEAFSDVVCRRIADWNDDPARTKRQVLAAFERVAKRLERRP